MNRNSHLKATYNPDPYLLWGQGFLWYTALMRPRIHTNALHICSTIADQWMHQELCIEEDNIFTYSKYYLLLQNAAYEVGVNHWQRAFVLHLATNCRTYLMVYWWPTVRVLVSQHLLHSCQWLHASEPTNLAFTGTTRLCWFLGSRALSSSIMS
jgi:hypothetical protein